MNTPLPAILLAAGGSTRMGRPKQLLPYRGRTLVWHAASVLIAGGYAPVCVVIGNEADAVADALRDLPVRLFRHGQWQRGIGSSLRVGVASLMAQPTPPAGVLVALADQPGVSATHLMMLSARFTPEMISASCYAGGAAVPAIFPAMLFDSLLTIADKAGAKSILAGHVDHLVLTELNEFEDIDRPEDCARLE